jgi:DNA polymerase (family 10)
LVKAALDAGCKMAISTDAHNLNDLKNTPLGVLCARRGWAEKKNILNCWSLSKIEKALKKKSV